MSAWLRLFRIEARRNVAVWLLPVMVVVAGLAARALLAPMVVLLWTETSMLARETVLFIGPLVAGAAAWMAGRERRSGIEELLASTPFAEPPRRVLAWAATSVWAMLAYLVVAAAIFAVTARRATWGSPILWPVVGGLLTLPAFAAAGYRLGVFLPSRFTSPLVTIALFAVLIVGGEIGALLGAPMWVASPIAGLYSSVWYGIQPEIGLPQALCCAGFTGLALASLSLRSRPGRYAGAFLLASVVLASSGMLMLKNVDVGPIGNGEGRPVPWKLIQYQPVCRGERLPICVHPAYQALLPELAPWLESLMAPLAGLPSIPARVEQMPSLDVDDQEVAVEAGVISITLSPESSAADSAAQLVAHALVHDQGPFTEAQAAIKAWLLRQAGLALQCDRVDPPSPEGSSFTPEECAAAERFAALDAGTRRRWLELHYEALREGRLRWEALP